MIQVLFYLFALILIFCGIYLIKKPQGLLLLFGEEEQQESRSFLKRYGLSYIVLGILGIVVGFFNTKSITMIFVLAVIWVSVVFSLSMNKRIKKG